MKKIIHIILAACSMLAVSCAVDEMKAFRTDKPVDMTQAEYLNAYDALKTYIDRSKHPSFKLGTGMSAAEFSDRAQMYALTVSNFDEMTPGNDMKYGSIVKDDGSMDFGTVQSYIENARQAGIGIYGHNLAWHAQQNPKYLNKLMADIPIPGSGQTGPVEMVKNNDCEGDDVSNYFMTIAQDGPKAASFSAAGQGADGKGRALLIPATAKVANPWDNQFFLRIEKPLEIGEHYRLSMKIRADKPARVGMQAHGEPGGYIHWSVASGSMDFTSEWAEYVWEGDNDTEGFHTIAWNLNDFEEANNYYFDDIHWEVGEPIPVIVTNHVKNPDCEGSDNSSYFSKVNYGAGNGQILNSEFTSPGADGTGHAVFIAAGAKEANAWDNQFFLKADRSFKAGEEYSLRMKIKADKPAQVGLQAHGEPGGYIHWSMASGSMDFTSEWTEYSYSGTIPAEADGMQTIAWNLNDFEGANTYYFDDIHWETSEQEQGGGSVSIVTNLVNNSDCEADDVSSYFMTIAQDGPKAASFSAAGQGADGKGRALLIPATAKVANPWDNQFFLRVDHVFEIGEQYTLSMKIRADKPARVGMQAHGEPGGYIHWSVASGSMDFTSEWTEYVWEGANDTEGFHTIAWNLNDFEEANNYYFDDIKWEITTEITGALPQTPEQKRDTLCYAMDRWIKGMMEACGGYVSAWDVVNEPIAGAGDDGEGFYPLQHDNGDKNNFFWQDYMGDELYVREAVKDARKYFEEFGGNPSELKLFVNDYNLESDWDGNKKAESLVHWIRKWESDGVTRIDGIGTQMHVSYYMNPDIQKSKEAAIENMFRILAESGKLIKITELDMGLVDSEGKTVMSSDAGFEALQAMSDFYKFIITKYFELIPESQQYGITIWAPLDSPAGSGWRPGEPIGIWYQNFNRKPAYAGVADALKAN